jgi:glycosyltransferase involved in cell wall biosynthesis
LKVSLVHPSLNRIGGAEAVLLEIIKALQESGHTVTIFTLDRVDWEKLGEEPRDHAFPKNEHYIYHNLSPIKNSFINLPLLAHSYLRLLFSAKKSGDDLSINNFGEIFPSIADLSYVHSVPLITFSEGRADNPYQIPFWRITSRLYTFLYFILEKYTAPSTIIANSRYNAEIIKRNTRKTPLVLYPPVNPSTTPCDISRKENLILTISRINSKKNLSIIPEIASRVGGEFKFVLMGGTDVRSATAIEGIKKNSQRLRTTDRVDVILDPDRSKIDEAFQKASIYLSTQPTEAFGIAVVEAMATGCVPVVPRDGGPWFDILDERQGRFGFSFTGPEQAAEIISRVLSNEHLRKQISERARRRSLEFNSERFRLRFLKLIECFRGGRGSR